MLVPRLFDTVVLSRKSTVGIEVLEQFILLIIHCPVGNTYPEFPFSPRQRCYASFRDPRLQPDGLGLEPARLKQRALEINLRARGMVAAREESTTRRSLIPTSITPSAPIFLRFSFVDRISESLLLHSIRQTAIPSVVYCRAVSAPVQLP